MSAFALYFYQQLYLQDNLVEANEATRQDCFTSMPKLVTKGQNQKLEKEITTKEVEKIVKSLHLGKALGLDLISSEFFKQCW